MSKRKATKEPQKRQKASKREEWLTINALAVQLHTDKRTIAGRLEGFPSKTVGGYKRYRLSDAKQITELAREHKQGRSELEEEELRERILARRIKNDQAQGRLTPNEEFISRLAKLAADQKQLLRQKLENELPQYLASCTEPAQARVMLKRVVDEVCQRMSDLLAEWKTSELARTSN